MSCTSKHEVDQRDRYVTFCNCCASRCRFVYIAGDVFLLAAGELAFDLLLNGVASILTQPCQRFVDGRKKLPCFFGRDLFLGWGRGLLYLNTDISLFLLVPCGRGRFLGWPIGVLSDWQS